MALEGGDVLECWDQGILEEQEGKPADVDVQVAEPLRACLGKKGAVSKQSWALPGQAMQGAGIPMHPKDQPTPPLHK